MGGMDPTPVGMSLEKHSAPQLLPRRLRMLWTPLATPGRQHIVLRHVISVPHPTRLPYTTRPHTVPGAQDPHAKPSLDPRWILAAGTASHTLGGCGCTP